MLLEYGLGACCKQLNPIFEFAFVLKGGGDIVRFIVAIGLLFASCVALSQTQTIYGPPIAIAPPQVGVPISPTVLPMLGASGGGTINLTGGGNLNLGGGAPTQIGAQVPSSTQGGRLVIGRPSATLSADAATRAIAGIAVSTSNSVNPVPNVGAYMPNVNPGTVVITGNAVAGQLPQAQLAGNARIATRAVIDLAGQVRLVGNGN